MTETREAGFTPRFDIVDLLRADYLETSDDDFLTAADEIERLRAKQAAALTMFEALRDLIPAVKEHINAAGGAGGYLLARLSDAEAALSKATETSNGE